MEKKQIFGIYFVLEKVWKIIPEKHNDLSAKVVRFNEFQSYFIKQNPHGICPQVSRTRSTEPVHGFIEPRPSNMRWRAKIRMTMKGYARD
jgi:hypothetical protein